MLQFNNNHIFTGYLKQFLSSFNLPTCKIYTAEFEKFYSEHGYEDPRVIESYLPIKISVDKIRPGCGITYLKDGCPQQYFWDTANWNTNTDLAKNKIIKYWKSNQILHYNGNKIFGLTKTLKNPTTLYNYQTHEYLGDYLRFVRDFENINLMSMYNCFSNRLCNNIKFKLELNETQALTVNAYDTNYKIYMLPVKLFEKYTIAIDCYQGIELFCGFYNEKLDTSEKAKNIIKRTYKKIPKALFNQPFIYDKLSVEHWNWHDENTRKRVNTAVTPIGGRGMLNTSVLQPAISSMDQILRSEVAMRESELKLFIKVPTSNTSSITVLEGDYRNYNDAIYAFDSKNGWQYYSNSTVANFETKKCINCKTCKDYDTCSNKTEKYCKNYSLPDLNSREFKPISKLQLLALNTGISYPFADRLIEYLVANVIVPNDITQDNIVRLQKVMEDCGYTFQIDGVWEPKMQMILYDYLMNSGKFTAELKKSINIRPETTGQAGTNQLQNFRPAPSNKIPIKTTGKIKDQRKGDLKQMGQKMRSDFYDVLGYGDKDAEKLYASWTTILNEKTGVHQVVAKNTLENVDIYNNLYDN
jgi:hypothetical protein